MAKKHNDSESMSKSKKRTVTPGAKHVAKPGQTESTASRQPAGPFLVKGRVMAADGSLTDALVRAVDQDRRGENALGEATTDHDGNYQITYSKNQFRRTEKEIGGPDLIVRVYSAEGKVMAQSKRKRNAGREEIVNLTVESEQPFTVSGTIRRGDGRPAAGALVRAYDQDLRKKQLLGKTTTDAAGHYSIAYTSRKFLRAEKTSADLYVVVVDAQGKELLSSGVLFNAPSDAVVDLTLPPDGHTLSEFELLLADILPLLTGQGKGGADLKISELEKKDIAFLGRESGQPQQHIAFLVQAFRVTLELLEQGKPRARSPQTAVRVRTELSVPPREAEVKTYASLAYAAFGQFPEADAAGLARLDQTALRARITAAVESGVIPKDHAHAIPTFLELLRARRIQDFLAVPTTNGDPHPIAVALKTVAPSPVLQTAVAELALKHGANDAEFWAALDSDKRVPRKLQRTLRASVDFLSISGGNVRLLEAIATAKSKDGGLIEPAKLVTLEAKDWSRLMGVDQRSRAVLPGPEAAAAVAASNRYTHTLIEAVERRYPNEKLADELSRDTQRGNPLLGARDDILTFLENNPDLHLIDTPVAGLLTGDKKIDAPRLKGVKDPKQTIGLLAAYQRLNRLLPELADTATTFVSSADVEMRVQSRYSVVSRLLSDGFTSALSITSLPFKEFFDRYVGRLGERDVLDFIYGRAQIVTDASVQIAIGIKDWADSAVPRALPRAASWADTFGGAESCECEQCLSIYSASAYLFDCLRFLEDAAGPIVASSPLSVLKGRRGDLLEILLTCDNTNTRIPYIDIVNELLEQRVSPDWFTPFSLPAAIETDLDARKATIAIRDAFHDSANAISLALDAEVYVVGQPTGGTKVWHLLDQATLYSIRKTTAGIWVESASFQTAGPEEELRAVPQHTIPSAYRKLELKVFPWSVPFSLTWAEVNEYLRRIDVNPSEILDAFASPSTPSSSRLNPFEAQDAVAGTYLGLSPTEFQIIAGQKTAGDAPIRIGGPTDFPDDFWGFARNVIYPLKDWDGTMEVLSWDRAVWRVPEFLKRSGLSYIQFLELLGCYFINPVDAGNVSGRTLFLASRDPNDTASCDLAKLEIQGVPPSTGVALATKIHRFVRLQRKIGWVVNDLDRTLVALNATTMEHDTLVAVSIVERLRRRTGLEIPELVSWFSDIDHATYYDFGDDDQPRRSSFYDEAFRLPDSVEPGTPFGDDPSAISGMISQYEVRLAARLGMSEPELDRLRSDVRILAAADSDSLTLSTLSALTRYASLARWTGLGVDELLDAADVFGFMPFATDTTTSSIERANTPLRFIEALDTLADAGLRPSEASYVFCDAGTLDKLPAIGETELVGALGALIDAVRPVLAQLDYPADPTGEVVAGELSKIGWSESKAREAASFFANRQIYSVSLKKTDAPLAQLRNQSRLVFDETAEVLSTQGSLTLNERNNFRQISGASTNFKAAVNSLYNQPRDFASAKLQYVLLPEYSIALSHLPGTLRLPKELDVALKFDADRRVLVFRGDRQTLDLVEYPTGTLNQEWSAFRTAINTLKGSPLPASVTQDPPPANNRFFETNAEIESLLDGTKTIEQRTAFALERIAKGRWQLESEKAAITVLSGVAGLDAALMRACRAIWKPLVIDATTNGPSALVRTQTAFSNAPASSVAAAVRRLHKFGVLSKGLGLPVREMLWLLHNSTLIGGPDLLQLPAKLNNPAIPWDQGAALVEFARASRSFLSAQGSLLDLMDVVFSDPPASHADWWTLVARIQDWEGAQVQALTGSPAFPDGFDRPQLYVRLLGKMKLAQRCGVSAGVLMNWNYYLASSPNGVWSGYQLNTVSDEVKSGVRAKVGRERWLQVATEVNDPLRERRRDALLTYMLSQPNPWDGTILRDTDQLFDYLLIDTQMASCMLTSRIVQAVSSVQSFMQRALMGLEPGVAITGERAIEWNTWRKQYRVWEANRKVFLYPENWIEPELRDDKSALFKDVESRLLQSALSAQQASKAVVAYVDGLTAASDLEVIGAYRQRELNTSGGIVDALHVVGRSHSLPRQYFYRRADYAGDMTTGTWTPWSKIELDIEGDHVLPFSSAGFTYIFWPVINQAVPKGSGSSADTAANKPWEIKLAWSQLKGTEWSPKRIARDSLYFDNDQGFEPRDAFMFEAQASTDGADVYCYGIKTITTGAVDPQELLPKISVATPVKFEFSSLVQFFMISVKVVDGAGFPIADATVRISELSVAASIYASTESVVPMGNSGPQVISWEVKTAADGTIHNLVPMPLSIAKQWTVSVRLPSAVAAEFAYSTSSRIVDTPASRSDDKWQLVQVDFTFSRKPVITTSLQRASIGRFSVDYSGRALVQSWSWQPQFAEKPLVTNTTWSDNAFIEANGSDDKLYLPELPSGALLAKTPGLFRLRSPGQVKLGIEPFYFFDAAGKSYQILFKTVSGGKKPVFTPIFHPYARSYSELVAFTGEDALLRRSIQDSTDLGMNFRNTFLSTGASTPLTLDAIPVEDVAFNPTSFFGSYNWELFFHLPLAVATQLTRNQRFADAQRWLHYIYDPTSAEANNSPQYSWKFKPFFDAPPATLAALFADSAALAAQLKVLRTDPFNPYAIARLRVVAFMKNVVMKYLDNLIAWGDQLFARDTMESINEATQLYLLAHQILGPRHERVPRRARPTPQTYRSMAELASAQLPVLSEIGIIAVEVSSFMPLSGPSSQSSTGGSLGSMMYFCVSNNEKLLDYWNLVDNRLFKLRHCLDIKGRFRIPALFEPPIDPALLVRARAAGVDIGDVLADAAAPLPNYRFNILSQKATELAAEVKSLGAALLSALEKRDGEELSLLRQRHELSLLPMVEEVRKKQIEEADAQLEGLRLSQDTVTERRRYYLRLLGKDAAADSKPPVKIDYLPAAVSIGGGGDDTNGLALSQHEIHQLGWLNDGNNFMLLASSMNVLGGALHVIPESSPVQFGGSHLGNAANAIGTFFNMLSGNASYQANRSSIVGSFTRRQDDWILQHNLAVNELRQIERQVVAAEIRKSIAEQELENHRKQIENSKEVELFLKAKFTNQQLYDWFVGQVSSMFFESYRLAHTVSKRAERSFRHELGREDSDFIKFGYWDDLKKGLLAGERLQQDLKRMEVAYLDENAREYEITKHVSLASLNPSALIELKKTGACEITIPEWAFDLDYAGHYMRRIKNVSVTIPCVVGPYAGVNCTLTLQSSSIRISGTNAGDYRRTQKQGMPDDDPRFVDRFSAVQSIVTSTAQNDAGMFETNLRDERYLPFEGQGVISRWRIELPAVSNSFDVNSVSDVILHIRYTAREGGSGLAIAAKTSLAAILKPTTGASLFRLFSMRHEFPDQWHRFISGSGSTLGPLDVSHRRFPLLFSSKKISILDDREYYSVYKDGISPLATVTTGGIEVELQSTDTKLSITTLKQRITLTIDRTKPDDLPVDLLIVSRFKVEDSAP